LLQMTGQAGSRNEGNAFDCGATSTTISRSDDTHFFSI